MAGTSSDMTSVEQLASAKAVSSAGASLTAANQERERLPRRKIGWAAAEADTVS